MRVRHNIAYQAFPYLHSHGDSRWHGWAHFSPLAPAEGSPTPHNGAWSTGRTHNPPHTMGQPGVPAPPPPAAPTCAMQESTAMPTLM